jgi:uncharacterized protein (TIGR02001 family)
MQNPCHAIGALAAASVLVADNAAAETEFQLHTGYTSESRWRGLDLGNDLIEAGVDVTAAWNGLGLSAGAWYGYFNYAHQNVDELDLYGEVSKDFGWIQGSIGYIAYLYPQTGSPTYQEIYCGISRDLDFATASLKYFWDVQGDNNGYTELGLSRSFTLNSCLSLSVDSNIGYMIEQDQATAWTTKLTLDWSFYEHAKLSPFVAMSIALSDDADTPYFHSNNECVGGAMLGYTF